MFTSWDDTLGHEGAGLGITTNRQLARLAVKRAPAQELTTHRAGFQKQSTQEFWRTKLRSLPLWLGRESQAGDADGEISIPHSLT